MINKILILIYSRGSFMSYAVNPPPYNPYHTPPTAYPVQPSAPPAPPPYYTTGEYTHSGFFGDPNLDQNKLGREMLEAVIANKTEWVPRVKIPQDSWFNRLLGWFSTSTALPQQGIELDDKAKSALYLQTGRLLYAEAINDAAVIEECTQMRKTNAVFQQFLESLSPEECTAEYCFTAAADLHSNNPEAFFELGKLNFLKHKYQQAVTNFHQAQGLSDKLSNSSSSRKHSFKALVGACAGAAYERLGYHDLALFDYIDASKIDPKGPQSYQESLSRNFQILKFKTNKSLDELQACMEYDPYDPDFPIELAHIKLNRGDFQSAIGMLTRSIDLAYYYKPSSLYRCAELAQQVAFAVNNSPVTSAQY